MLKSQTRFNEEIIEIDKFHITYIGITINAQTLKWYYDQSFTP